MKRVAFTLLCGSLMLGPALAPTYAGQWCHNIAGDPGPTGQGNWICEPGPGGSANAGEKYAGLAISRRTYRAGVSYGENSAAQAEPAAVTSCAQNNGGNDCKSIQWVRDGCVEIAISREDRKVGWTGVTATRLAAFSAALSKCRTQGGKSCNVIATPCAGDDPRFAPPLPPGVAGATIDSSIVGTWMINMNPGRWVWEIGAHGTYEFHSEAPDLAPTHAGLITAANGKWTLQATAGIADSDGGTYQLPGPDTMVMTGKLGTGTWRRIE